MKRSNEFQKDYSSNINLFGDNVKTILKKALLVLFLALISTPVFSQDELQKNASQVQNLQQNLQQDLQVEQLQSILEVKFFLKSLKDYEESGNLSYSYHDRVYSLLYDLHSSVYYYDGVMKVYGPNPTNFFTNAASLSTIPNNPNNNNVEIVTIYINSLNDVGTLINLNSFNSFHKLKYVYIVSKINITEAQIIAMINNWKPKYSVFYKISREDNY